MYIDNLTLTGLLITLPYTVMLFMFGKEKFEMRQEKAVAFEYTAEESYCYGT